MKVKYHDPDMPKLEYVGGADKSNWMDLRAVKVTVIKPSGEVKTYVGFDEVTYKRDDLLKISFGISAELPEGKNKRLFHVQAYSKTTVYS